MELNYCPQYAQVQQQKDDGPHMKGKIMPKQTKKITQGGTQDVGFALIKRVRFKIKAS